MAIINVTLDTSNSNGTNTFSNGNLTVNTKTGSNTNIRATHGKKRGKWYWEVKLDSGATHWHIAVSNSQYPITSTGTISGDATNNLRGYYVGNGNRIPENTAYGATGVLGDIFGIALDMDNGTLGFYRNGVSLGISHTNLLALGEVFPHFKSGGANSKTMTVNFGATPFAYPIPSGYSAYNIYPVAKLILKNNTSLYSLDNKTLIPLPSSSDKNMILHGLEAGKEVQLDTPFNKMKYVQDASELLGEGKKFEHTIDTSKVKINKLIL